MITALAIVVGLLIASVLALTGSWAARLMALAVVLEVGMAQYWRRTAEGWEVPYWRDIELRRLQSKWVAQTRQASC